MSIFGMVYRHELFYIIIKYMLLLVFTYMSPNYNQCVTEVYRKKNVILMVHCMIVHSFQ